MNTGSQPDWEQLIALSLENQLTSVDQARLEAALAADPAVAALHQEMKSHLDYWERVLVPAVAEAEAAVAQEVIPPMPAEVRRRLDTLRRSAAQVPADPPAHRSRWLALAALLIMVATVLRLVFPHSPTTTPGMARVRLLAPAPGQGTALADPVFVWDSQDAPGQRYDVWVLPEGADQESGKPLGIAESVVSPLAWSAMHSGSGEGQPAERLPLLASGGYQVLVCLAGHGRLAGVPRAFSVEREAAPPPDLSGATPGEALLVIQRVMQDRPGDALMLLSRLPGSTRQLPEFQLLEKSARQKAAAVQP